MKKKKRQQPTRYGTIISFRVTDDELETITGIRETTRMSTTELLKSAFDFYVSRGAAGSAVTRRT